MNRLFKAKGFEFHGSGFLKDVKRCNNSACHCQDCKMSDQPFPEWGEVFIMTAAHVVFDEAEASHTKCEFFYDDPEAESDKILTLNGFEVVESDSESDRCLLKYVTHDLELLFQKLNGLLEDYWNAHHRTFELQNPVTQMVLDLWRLVVPKDRWMIMTSHPHACVKQVTIGKCRPKKWSQLFFQKTQYSYTTPTCTGCSGSAVNVFMPRWNITTWCDHSHFGANKDLSASASECDDVDGIGDEVMPELTLFSKEKYNKGRRSFGCRGSKSGNFASDGGNEKDRRSEKEGTTMDDKVIYNFSGVGNDDRLFQRMFMCGLVVNLISNSLNTAHVLQHQITNASLIVFLMLSFNLFMAGLSLFQIFGVLVMYFSTMVGTIWVCEEVTSQVLLLSPLVVLVIYWMYTSPIHRKIQEVHWISSMTVYLQLVCLVMLCDFSVMTTAKWIRLFLCLVLVLFVSKKVHRSSYEAGSRWLRLYLVAVVYVLSFMFLLAIQDETNPNKQEDGWFPNFDLEWDCLWSNSDSNVSQAMADIRSKTEISCPSELRNVLDRENLTLEMQEEEGSFSFTRAGMISMGLRLMLLAYEFLPT